MCMIGIIYDGWFEGIGAFLEKSSRAFSMVQLNGNLQEYWRLWAVYDAYSIRLMTLPVVEIP